MYIFQVRIKIINLFNFRFGLLGLPFEPELFDTEISLASNFNTLPCAITRAIFKNSNIPVPVNTVFDLKRMCATGIIYKNV